MHFFHRAIGFNHSLLQVVTNSLILRGWIKHTKKGIVCQENRTLVITNSNHAYFVKILGRGFREGVFTKKELRASPTIESKGSVSVYWFLDVISLENKRYRNKIEVAALNSFPDNFDKNPFSSSAGKLNHLPAMLLMP